MKTPKKMLRSRWKQQVMKNFKQKKEKERVEESEKEKEEEL
jgi:hypothetical protein